MIIFLYWWTVLSVITTCTTIYIIVERSGWDEILRETELDGLPSPVGKGIYTAGCMLIGLVFFPIMLAGLTIKISRR